MSHDATRPGDDADEPAATAADWSLTPDDEAALERAAARIERGEGVPWEVVGAKLRRRIRDVAAGRTRT